MALFSNTFITDTVKTKTLLSFIVDSGEMSIDEPQKSQLNLFLDGVSAKGTDLFLGYKPIDIEKNGFEVREVE